MASDSFHNAFDFEAALAIAAEALSRKPVSQQSSPIDSCREIQSSFQSFRRNQSQESLSSRNPGFSPREHSAPGFPPSSSSFPEHPGSYPNFPPSTPNFQTPSYPPGPHHSPYPPPMYYPPPPGYPPYHHYPYPHDPYYPGHFSSREDPRSGRTNKRMQVISACLNCRKRKKKCGGEKPCDRCITLHLEDSCVYDDEEEKSKKRSKTEEAASPLIPTATTTPSLGILPSIPTPPPSVTQSIQPTPTSTSPLGTLAPAFSQATLAALGSAISALIPNLATAMQPQQQKQQHQTSGGGASDTPTAIDPRVSVVSQLLSLAGANSANLEKFSAGLQTGQSSLPSFGNLFQMPVPQEAFSAAAAAAATQSESPPKTPPTIFDQRQFSNAPESKQQQQEPTHPFLKPTNHMLSGGGGSGDEGGHKTSTPSLIAKFLDDLSATSFKLDAQVSGTGGASSSAGGDSASGANQKTRSCLYPSSLTAHAHDHSAPQSATSTASSFPNFSFLDGFGSPQSCHSPPSTPSLGMYPTGYSLLTGGHGGLDSTNPSPFSTQKQQHQPSTHHHHHHGQHQQHPSSTADSSAASKLPQEIISLASELKHEKDQNEQLRQEIELLRQECGDLRAKIPHFISKLRAEGNGCSFVENVLVDQVMNCPTAMMVRNVRDLSIVLVNSKFCDILGYTPEEMRTSPKCQWWKIIHPSCWLDMAQMVLAYFSSPKAASMSYIMKQNYVHKDGSIVPVVCSLMLLSDDDEPFPHYCIINLVAAANEK